MLESKMKLSAEDKVAAWKRRDSSYDGLFVFAVKTTGIFCRPSCPSQPRLENMEFFETAGEAVRAGYRPCKRCHPELANGTPPEWVSQLLARADAAPDTRISANDLRALGVPPERARRWFQKHYGMTFAAWCRGLRLSRAFTQIRSGAKIDDVILSHGFESHSGFREAFTRTFNKAPGRIGQADCLHVALLQTPLGPMLAATSNSGVCQLEFADRRGLEKSYEDMRKHFQVPVIPGNNAVMDQLRAELDQYFRSQRQEFSVPLVMKGSAFQERAWNELTRIPHGETASYEEVAARLGAPTAVRAVARANATNRIYLLVPCHRVIAKSGELSGYGGGVWRKRLLLNFERTGVLSVSANYSSR